MSNISADKVVSLELIVDHLHNITNSEFKQRSRVPAGITEVE
jgi:hypothetical protein